jgi:alkylated DNA repair dioxygenase AlkB
MEPLPWTPLLAAIRARAEACAGVRFNSVLCNRYRSGADTVGWHRDNERELGPEPVIASVSFGATRRFLLRHVKGPDRAEIGLEDGSVLVMRGQTQQRWRHSVPRTAQAVGERVNLTFRLVNPR